MFWSLCVVKFFVIFLSDKLNILNRCFIINIFIDENFNFCCNFLRVSEIFGYEVGNLEILFNLKNFYFEFK